MSRPVRIPCRSVSVFLTLVLALAACGENVAPIPIDEPMDDPGGGLALRLNAGSVGLVVDVREIFRRGYFPTEAEFTFRDHPAFDAMLEVDARTNVVVLSIHNDSLTDAEKADFAAGIVASIVVRDANQMELASFSDDQLILDDANRPLTIGTPLPHVPRPIMIEDGKPYLIQQEDTLTDVNDKLLRSFSNKVIGTGGYDPQDAAAQQFFFFSTGNADSYVIGQASPTRHFCVMTGSSAFTPTGVDARFLELQSACNSPADSAVLVLEQDDDGWIRMRLESTGEYLELKDGEALLADPNPNTVDEASRFRAISDNIEWTVTDRGTFFAQPIMPAARLDFAFQGNLTNCSDATLTETVGRSQTRSRTTTFGTSESLQFFSSASIKVGTTIGTEIKASPDGSFFSEVTMSSEISTEVELATSNTWTTGNTFEESSTVTEEVSRTRQVEIPPQTAIRVSDFVRAFENVTIPFTQQFRIRARYRDDNTILSGQDIATQVLFNFFTGVVTTVGGDFVDLTIRGEARTNQFFEAETAVENVAGACSG